LLISDWPSLDPLSSHTSASLSSIWLSWFMELQIMSPARGWGAGGASRIEAPICGFDRMQPLLAPSSCEFSLLCVSVGWAAASTENSLDGNWSFGLVLTLVRNGLDTMGIEGKQVQFGLDYSHTWAGLDWFGPKLFGLRLLEIVDRRVVWHQFNLSLVWTRVIHGLDWTGLVPNFSVSDCWKLWIDEWFDTNSISVVIREKFQRCRKKWGHVTRASQPRRPPPTGLRRRPDPPSLAMVQSRWTGGHPEHQPIHASLCG
jgi:hypothetical protein